MKKLTAILMAACMITAGSSALAEDDITVNVNGEPVAFDAVPYVENDRTMVPFRTIAEALGIEVEWDGEMKKVTASAGENNITLYIDFAYAHVNNMVYKLEAPAVVKNDRTFIPLRFFSEAFGAGVQWDQNSRTVDISVPKSISDIKLIDEKYGLLNNRLRVSMPGNASYGEDYSYMYISGIKGDTLKLYAGELYCYSEGDIQKDAENLKLTAADGAEILNVNGLELLELQSGSGENGDIILRDYLVKSTDDSLMRLRIDINAEADKNHDDMLAFADKITASIEADLELGMCYKFGHEGRLAFSIDEGYAFAGFAGGGVYVTKLRKSSEPETGLKIIIGESDETHTPSGSRTIEGSFLDETLTWYIYDGSMEAVHKCSDNTSYIMYADFNDEQEIQDYIDMAGKIREGGFAAAAKPVIYLYPERELEVDVSLELDGDFTFTYPEYNNGWHVTARPDGTVISDGQEYSYLFWEGYMPGFKPDFKEGFVVKGEDSVEFLRKTLSEMGLTPREYNEFIVYWAPKLQENEYNKIYFAAEEYENAARLKITPEPDSLLRVFMVYEKADKETVLMPQEIKPFERKGFTAVEWGGYMIK